MLQLRGDNEQFSSLPSLRPLDHPRHSIITTDRPDSSQLVDLHIYVVPKTVWKDGQRLAQNEAMNDAASAGFVRVSPHLTIRELRKTIDTLCGKESHFPRDFIYLRSVGRCMTKVKTKQEDELRVKNYRPPQTFAPEIYLLEGRQEDYVQNESVSPVSTSPCEICGTHDGHRADHEKQRPRRNAKRADPNDDYSDRDRRRFPSNDLERSPSRLSQTYRKPLRAANPYPPLISSDEIFSRKPPPERPNYRRYAPNGSDPEDSMANLSEVRSTPSSSLPKLKAEQERLRRRQAELERMRRAAEEKRARSQRSDGEPSRSDAEDEPGKRTQASHRGIRDPPGYQDRPGLQNRSSFQEPKKPTLSGYVALYLALAGPSICTSRVDRLKRVDDDDDERKAPVKSQAPYHNSRRQTYPMPVSLTPKHENPKPAANPKRSRATGNNNDYENTRNEISPLTKERRESVNSPSPPAVPADEPPMKNQLNSQISIKTEKSPDRTPLLINSPVPPSASGNTHPSDTPNAPKEPMNKPLPEPTSEVNLEEKRLNEEIDTERRNAELKRRQQMEEDLQKKRDKPSDEQRRKDLFKGIRDDPAALRTRHQEIHSRRLDLERIREEVIRHLKNIHNRITLRRKEARDMWKKKYFNEKKKHTPLEERITTLRNEVDQMHKKTVQTMEAEAKYAAQMGYAKEAAAGNSIAHVTRVNYEIAEIRHQLEQAKLKLTTDVKLRNQAENECRTLKHELTQAKKNLNDIKSRAGP